MIIKKSFIKQYCCIALLAAVIGATSCSTDVVGDASSDNLEGPLAEVEAIDISNDLITRAAGMDLESFSLSVYNSKNGRLLADKIQYQITDAGVTSNGAWRMAAAEMKAIGVSPTMDIVENVTLTASDSYFDYMVPTTDQVMLKIGSDMSFTKQSTNNKLAMKFVNALAMFSIKARNELKVEDSEGTEYDVTIYVKSVTLHNLAAKGRFTYTGNYKGNWETIDDVYYNYTQELPEKVELGKTNFIDVMDSIFVFLPQSPENNAWNPEAQDDDSEEYAAANGIAKANADHKVYIELRCSMTADFGDGPVYLWGSENTYTPIYFPYIKKYCPKAWNTINKQGVYNLKILKGEALDADGRPIKPQAQENGESFENAVFISVAPTDDNDEDYVDDWNDPEDNTVEFSL